MSDFIQLNHFEMSRGPSATAEPLCVPVCVCDGRCRHGTFSTAGRSSTVAEQHGLQRPIEA